MNKIREPFNAYTHVFGAVLSIIGMLFLILKKANKGTIPLDILIYGLGLFLMFLASSLYHSLNCSSKTLSFLRRLDHCSIFVLIAATYTPVIVEAANKEWRSFLLILIWTIAAAGIFFKIFFSYPSRFIYTSLYISMGWVGIFFLPKIQLPRVALFYALEGGVVYTVGALSYMLKWPNASRSLNFHNLWHIMVLLGCFFMYLMVYNL
ncbi:hemolysin III family protein [Methylacidiphilum caldifontis]|uniref:PAQR family membrane homeostasis protein TrhA n=1 Tax=Methylacidiphilum caldifontis TaxID=2795386 RepID=UPI001A8CBAEB|nr:hemolysin III family protein [Methylacidiphilum caldifontis]QSR88010.1 hemolysin III family protein [Methylacidiphilum caldifontis]